jgi:addiction module RelB/DinJ family antitoxin
MNTASILIKTDPAVKARAQKTAKNLGISLTSVINGYLRHFIQVKSITFIDEEVPNERTLKLLKESEEDYKNGRFITFKSWEEEKAYLEKEIEDEKRKKSTAH